MNFCVAQRTLRRLTRERDQRMVCAKRFCNANPELILRNLPPIVPSHVKGEAMTPNVLNLIIGRAKRDPGFFHRLVFEPEKALKDIPELTSADRSAIVAIKPEEFFIGGLNIAAECGDTCGDRSCSRTCGW